MKWTRAIARGTFTGTAVGVVLLVAMALGLPNVDELMVVLPILTIELTVLYAATLTIVYLPVVALVRAAGWPRLVWVAGFALWPAPVLLARLAGDWFHINARPTLADDLAFLAQNVGMSVPLLAGLAVAGLVFARASAQPSDARLPQSA